VLRTPPESREEAERQFFADIKKAAKYIAQTAG
jgi:hypothetical protein